MVVKDQVEIFYFGRIDIEKNSRGFGQIDGCDQNLSGVKHAFRNSRRDEQIPMPTSLCPNFYLNTIDVGSCENAMNRG